MIDGTAVIAMGAFMLFVLIVFGIGMIPKRGKS
jgi:hypothetical protein